MKSRYLLFALVVSTIMAANAQETYENTNLIDNDLNGTARYMGMGGALEALGADISTISSNPAGIGLFRHPWVGTSFGFVSQQGAKKFADGNKTNMSFDQIGFVYTFRMRENSFLNFAINYHKSRNFDMLVRAADNLAGTASQNKLTYEKYRNGIFQSPNDVAYSQVDALYMNNLLYNEADSTYYYYPAQDYLFNRTTQGYIGEYDFNISGNVDDRFYWGVTFGLHDVHYKHYSEYSENFMRNPEDIAGLTLGDDREITGTGFDIKLGTIIRPIESNPFRFGIYVQTPTWYDLTTRNYTTLTDGSYTPYNGESYDFKVFTPWKFGLSLGSTFGECLAIGATYEYADYGTMKSRIKDGGYYDDWGDYYDDSHNDRAMNRHTDHTLKGVSTLKFGLELKPAPEFAVRLGYNYVSSLFNKNGQKDGTIESPGSYYASQTDYTNWKSTNRITCGLGYTIKNHFNIDLAYQYSVTNGNFHPFEDYVDNGNRAEDNVANAVKVDNKHHQLLLTLGYTF